VPRAHGGTLVVVSHVSPIKAAVTWALGVGDAVTWRMRLDNASLCRLDVVGEHAAMRSFNETAHLIDLR
jgi:broad specificity phosphatase PhoE